MTLRATGKGGFKESFNVLVKHKLERLLSDEETREDRNDFYVGYLKKSLADIESTHGGYWDLQIACASPK